MIINQNVVGSRTQLCKTIIIIKAGIVLNNKWTERTSLNRWPINDDETEIRCEKDSVYRIFNHFNEYNVCYLSTKNYFVIRLHYMYKISKYEWILSTSKVFFASKNTEKYNEWKNDDFFIFSAMSHDLIELLLLLLLLWIFVINSYIPLGRPCKFYQLHHGGVSLCVLILKLCVHTHSS